MNFDSQELELEQLESVSGGVLAASSKYVEATCEHCGAKGKHLMNTGWSAICRSCGKTINLKAQG